LTSVLPTVAADESPQSINIDELKKDWSHAVEISFGIIFLIVLAVVWCPCSPKIEALGPSFFFWLGMFYLSLLLIMVLIYTGDFCHIQQIVHDPFVNRLPIAVPWFGALGAVMISLQGVFNFNGQWDPKYNYWHLARPLFGAVVGIVSYFLIVLVVNSTGQKDADGSADVGNVFYYVVAFLVGYREETFRELLQRVADIVLRPGEPPAPAPSVTVKVNGAIRPTIDCGQVAANQANPPILVEIYNTGTARLLSPAVSVTSTNPTPVDTFKKQNDQLTADIDPGAFKTVEVVFKPNAAGPFAGVLTVTAQNLTAAKTIPLSGTGTQ